MQLTASTNEGRKLQLRVRSKQHSGRRFVAAYPTLPGPSHLLHAVVVRATPYRGACGGWPNPVRIGRPPNARVQLRSRAIGAMTAAGELRGFVSCNDSLGG